MEDNQMTAQDILGASLVYIEYISPFILVYSAVAMADDLISLVKKAAAAMRG
jgi:hypothetical protein